MGCREHSNPESTVGWGKGSVGREDSVLAPGWGLEPVSAAGRGGGRQLGNTRTTLTPGSEEDSGCLWESALTLPLSLCPRECDISWQITNTMTGQERDIIEERKTIYTLVRLTPLFSLLTRGPSNHGPAPSLGKRTLDQRLSKVSTHE